MSSPEDGASQGSGVSMDIQLSQETFNQVLNAVGMSSGSDSNRYNWEKNLSVQLDV